MQRGTQWLLPLKKKKKEHKKTTALSVSVSPCVSLQWRPFHISFAGGLLTPHTQYEQDVVIVCRIVNFDQKVCRVKRSVCLHVWSERAQEVEPTR